MRGWGPAGSEEAAPGGESGLPDPGSKRTRAPVRLRQPRPACALGHLVPAFNPYFPGRAREER